MEYLGISSLKCESVTESKQKHPGSCLKEEDEEQAPVTNMVSVIKAEKQDETNILGSTSIQSLNCFVKKDIKKGHEDNIIVGDIKDILTWEEGVDHYVEKPKNEPASYGDLKSVFCTQSSSFEDNFKNARNIGSNNGLDIANKRIEDVCLKEEIDVKFHKITEEENSHQPSKKEAVILYSYCDVTDSRHFYQAQNQKLHQRSKHSLISTKNKCDETSHLDTCINMHNKIMNNLWSVGKRMFCCDICSKKFGHKGDLTKHVRVHTGERPYTCNICSKTFSISGNLTTHMRLHSGERPYSCNICSKKFSQSSHFIRHMSVHTGDRPYSCNICSQKFACKEYLTRHMKLHAGARPYYCNICSKFYNCKRSLIAHMRIHTGDRPYSCHICCKIFSRSSHLTEHMRVHTRDRPYSCHICCKTFSRTSHLTVHMRVHTGYRPYSCYICSKTFNLTSHLTRHIRLHTGEIP